MTRSVRNAAALMAGVLALAGCGSSAGHAAPPTGAPSTTAPITKAAGKKKATAIAHATAATAGPATFAGPTGSRRGG